MPPDSRIGPQQAVRRIFLASHRFRFPLRRPDDPARGARPRALRALSVHGFTLVVPCRDGRGVRRMPDPPGRIGSMASLGDKWVAGWYSAVGVGADHDRGACSGLVTPRLWWEGDCGYVQRCDGSSIFAMPCQEGGETRQMLQRDPDVPTPSLPDGRHGFADDGVADAVGREGGWVGGMSDRGCRDGVRMGLGRKHSVICHC